jgi:hypothetical protein
MECREMAVKEASQREIIEQQFVQIADLQKANNRYQEVFGQVSALITHASGSDNLLLGCITDSWAGEDEV